MDMTTEKKKWTKLSNIDMKCFGCGPENTHGLKMTFETNGERVRSIVYIPEHMRGWRHIVHGGVLSTICDEIMAWAAIHLLGRFILTKRITTTFLKPVMIGSTLTAEGFVKERVDEKNAVMACDILDEQTDKCAAGQGDFVLFTREEFEKFGLIPKDLLDKMTLPIG